MELTVCYRNRNKLDNRLGCGNIISSRLLKLLVFWQLTMPGFKHLVVHQKTKKWFTHQWVFHQLSML